MMLEHYPQKAVKRPKVRKRDLQARIFSLESIIEKLHVELVELRRAPPSNPVYPQPTWVPGTGSPYPWPPIVVSCESGGQA